MIDWCFKEEVRNYQEHFMLSVLFCPKTATVKLRRRTFLQPQRLLTPRLFLDRQLLRSSKEVTLFTSGCVCFNFKSERSVIRIKSKHFVFAIRRCFLIDWSSDRCPAGNSMNYSQRSLRSTSPGSSTNRQWLTALINLIWTIQQTSITKCSHWCLSLCCQWSSDPDS